MKIKNIKKYKTRRYKKMVNADYKKKVAELVKMAKEKNLIKKYAEFCDTDKAKKCALSNDDVIYYTSLDKGVTK